MASSFSPGWGSGTQARLIDREQGGTCERGIGGVAKIDVKLKDVQVIRIGEVHEEVRLPSRRQCASIKIRGQQARDALWLLETDSHRGIACQHITSIEGTSDCPDEPRAILENVKRAIV